MKKIEWTKKRITLLIVIISLILALIGGAIAAIFIFGGSPKSNKVVVKKVVVVQDDEEDEENEEEPDDEEDEEEDNDSSEEEDYSDDNSDSDYDSDDTSSDSDSSDDNDSNKDNNSEDEDKKEDSSDKEDENDDSSDEDDDDSFLVKIIKRMKRNFSDFSPEEEEITYSNSEYAVKTLYAKDFGIKGDGKTDDGPAIFKAVMELTNCGPGSKLIFESGKTYYSKNITLNSLIYITGVEGLTIDGKGSTFLLDTKKQYLTLSQTKDCVVKNFVFDFKTKPAFRATCVSVNAAEGTAIMKADRNIGIADGNGYSAPIGGWFGVLDKHDSRYHMYISKYEMISNAEGTFKIKFDTTDANTKNWLSNGMLQTYGMICPMPDLGHLQERGFTISKNYDGKMENILINSCARFGMYIGENESTFTFKNVDFTPADNDLDRDMNFTSWRDAFHVKDNRAKMNWIDCDATGNYDDVFNISSSTLYVSDYNTAKNRITLVWPERDDGLYYTIRPGDELNIIDTETGEDCGTAKVKRVVSQSGGENIVVLDKPIEMLSYSGETVLAFFNNRCAPDSTIKNCNFNGTFRFRGPLTISDTYMYNQRTWIDLYGKVEGPVPKNITYKNCTLDSGSSGTFIIGANSGNSEKYGYHVKNIKFIDCKLGLGGRNLEDVFTVYESDKPYVSIKNCTEQDGTKIPDMN